MTGTVLEVGPAAVRPLAPRVGPPVERDMVAAALSGIDDTVVLFRERPVAVADLWRRIIASLVEERCESLTVVHPSWWSEDRVETVVEAATTIAAEVNAQPRSTVLTSGERATVVEIADDVVAIITDCLPPVIRSRLESSSELTEVIEKQSDTAVLIDAPPTVSGSAEYARELRATLRHRGVDARMVRLRVQAGRDEPQAAPAQSRRRRRRGAALVAAGTAISLCAMGATAARTRTPAPTSDAMVVVEGRITVRIPPNWVVSRVTAGPGSRRIQASSPTESITALHITQSYSPTETLARTAEVLRQAFDKQPHGAFVDFNPDDRRGGRPAITYREVRIAREINWTVILDGSTRIGIGCQSEHGRLDTVAAPCEQAINSAHEMSGTNSSP